MWGDRVYELLALYCWPDSAVDLKLLHEIKFINFFKWLKYKFVTYFYSKKDLLNNFSFTVELKNIIPVIHHLKRKEKSFLKQGFHPLFNSCTLYIKIKSKESSL